jgi:hypothetical protein
MCMCVLGSMLYEVMVLPRSFFMREQAQGTYLNHNKALLRSPLSLPTLNGPTTCLITLKIQHSSLSAVCNVNLIQYIYLVHKFESTSTYFRIVAPLTFLIIHFLYPTP